MEPSYVVCRGCMCKESSSLEWMRNENLDFQTLKFIYTDLTRLKVCKLIISQKPNLTILGRFQVSDDDTLPHHLCQKCCNSLKEFDTFKQTCVKSYQILRSLDIKDEMPDDEEEKLFKVELEVCADSLGGSDNSSSEDSKRRQPRIVKKKHGKRKYMCCEPGCSSKFSSKSAFKSHQNYHRGEAYECDYCQMKVSSLKILQRHLRSHTESNATPTKPAKSTSKPHQFRCPVADCNKTFMVEETYLALVFRRIRGSFSLYSSYLQT
jgi:Zinc-finger associated domain (zf-AD)